MFNIMDGYTRNFNIIVNSLVEEVVNIFIELATDLKAEHMYDSVFPIHMIEDKEFMKDKLHTLHRLVKDEYYHDISALDEYVIHGILIYIDEIWEDEFTFEESISKKLLEVDITEEEKELLKGRYDIYNLIYTYFRDIDFLTILSFFDAYKENPLILEKFFDVNIDYYKELMPLDILKEYEDIKKSRENKDKENKGKENKKENVEIIHCKEDFFEVVKQSVYDFNHRITHDKLYQVINGPTGTATEKIVQILYNIMAKKDLERFNILVQQESDINRGIVDFNLSIGLKYQALIEFKLDKNSQKSNGIKYQLPLYLIKEKIDFGIFVLICFSDESYEEAEKYYIEAEQASNEYKKNIMFLRINASGNYKTASKVRSKEEMGFEDWRTFN